MGSTGQQAGRLVDYFAVCGLDLTTGFQPGQFSGDTDHIHPLLRGYKSQVLTHYPSVVDWNPFDHDGVNMLCMPKGLSLCTQREDRDPKFHSFLMTKEDGSRTYGTSLTFYEIVTDEGILSELETLQIKYVEHLRRRKTSTPTTPSHVVLESFSPKIERRHMASPSRRRASSPAINIHSPKPRRRMTPTSTPTHSARHFDPKKDRLYATKCICLIQQVPFVQACQKFLEQIYESVKALSAPELPIECYIYNILYEVPLPPPGRSMVFSAISRNITCQRPSSSELPMCDYSMRQMFQVLGLENIIQLFTCAMLENQIMLVSRNYQRLMLVAECISSLMFPFQWQHVYVPILPASMLHFLDAPVPFIMGLHLDNTMDQNQLLLEIPNQASLCYVDIDNHYIELPEDMPQLPDIQQLKHDVCEVLHKYHISPEPSSDVFPSTSESKTDNNIDWSKLQTQLTLIGSPHRNLNLETGIETDHDSSYFSSPSRGDSPTSSMPTKSDILRNNEIVSKVAAIVQRTGVIQSISEFEDSNSNSNTNSELSSPIDAELRVELDELIFASSIREIFLCKLVGMLRHYETFVIQPMTHSLESWIANREHMTNFDKTSFLSDQPEAYLPFLSPFTETQMFATFIDNKIIANWEEKEDALRIFDARIFEHFPASAPQTPTVEIVPFTSESESAIRMRARSIDYTAVAPHQLASLQPDLADNSQNSHKSGIFPKLHDEVLLKQPHTPNNMRHRNSAQWRRKDRQQQHSEHLQLAPQEREQYIQQAKRGNVSQPVLSHYDQVQTNWKFVEGLLKECKVKVQSTVSNRKYVEGLLKDCKLKTKKMLVSKMGQEAVELGHGDVNRSGVEENTLIASLCDLLERIFSHGMIKKQGKSALWSHLVSYRKLREKRGDTDYNEKPVVVPGWDGSLRRRSNATQVPELIMFPLPTDLLFDMRNVEKMSQIKTDVGHARAFVRLALERKLLHKHLQQLVSDYELCKRRYKRYAFLRTEEEKEQFLFHLLSLNAVDYFCFTNSFTTSTIVYQVIIIHSRKFQSMTTANAYVIVAGEIAESGKIPLPKGSSQIMFEHKNLGVLTTIRIGHDNSGLLPRWMVDYVLLRNEVTGHMYRFPCGRWIGRGVDDGSLERLLVGELIQHPQESDEPTRGMCTPPIPSSPSPSPSRQIKGPMKPDRDMIQEMLTDAVNSIVKHFYKPEKERGRLTVLLCGERGLVKCMEYVLQHGFRSARLFRNNFFVWDFLEKVAKYLDSLDNDDEGRLSSQQEKRARRTFCHTICEINFGAHMAGKDGKFQLLMCLGIRDHMLHQWLPLLAETPVATSMYDECSFFHSHSALDFLVNLLMQLEEFNITLESSITKGLEL